MTSPTAAPPQRYNIIQVRWFLALCVVVALVDVAFVWLSHMEHVRAELKRKAQQNRSAMSTAMTVNLRSVSASMQLQAMLLAEDPRVQALLTRAGDQQQRFPAQEGDGNQWIRKELYDRMEPEWQWLRAHSSSRYLHFHILPGPVSFLRMYEPGRHGDDAHHLAVARAAALRRPTSAFETGRVYSGIRGAAPVTAPGRLPEAEPVGVVEVGTSFEVVINSLKQAFADFGTDMHLAVLLRLEHLDDTMWPDKLLDRTVIDVGETGYVVESTTSDQVGLVAATDAFHALSHDLPGVEIVRLGGARYEIMAIGIPLQGASDVGMSSADGKGRPADCLIMAWHPLAMSGPMVMQSLKRSALYGAISYVVIILAAFAAWNLGSRHLRHLVSKRTEDLVRVNSELERAERSYRGIYESAIQGMFQSSLDGRYFSVNPAFARMLGYDAHKDIDRLSNPAMEMLLSGETGSRLMDVLLQQRAIENHQAELKRKDGSRVFVLGNMWLNQDETGTSYIEGIVVDDTARRLAEAELREKQLRLDEDLTTAAEVQLSLLPADVPESECFNAEWRFKPSSQVSGDILNIFELDCEHLAFYVLDVSGHGVPSSLVGASASQALQPYSYFCSWSPEGPGSAKCNHPPKVVLELLNMEFPFTRFDRFLTICYMVLNLRTGVLSYCNAGHPEPCLLHGDGSVEILPVKNTIIGLDPNLSYEQGSRRLEPGDKIFVYTDGVVDYRRSDGTFFGDERLMGFLKNHKGQACGELLDNLNAELMDFGRKTQPRDDITMLCVEFCRPIPSPAAL